MAPMFKVRPLPDSIPASTATIDLRGVGSDDYLQPSMVNSDYSTEKSGKIRKSKVLQAKYLPFLLVGLVLFTVFSMYQAKQNSDHVMRDVSNNHAFGMMKQKKQTEAHLQQKVAVMEKMVREYQPVSGNFMENDPTAMELTRELQHRTQELILTRYGDHTFRVALDLEFPSSVPDFAEKGNTEKVIIEMAPVALLPCSVYFFLEIVRTFKEGSFIRNADHVLQASVISKVRQEMPFQEYSPEHPHAMGTTGYAGRPSGPGFYISIEDNTKNHGPGSQQKENPYEADANFGHVVQGMENVVPRMHSIPQNEWLDKENEIKITSMTIFYGDRNIDGSVEWKEWTKMSSSSPSVK